MRLASIRKVLRRSHPFLCEIFRNARIHGVLRKQIHFDLERKKSTGLLLLILIPALGHLLLYFVKHKDQSS